MSVADLIAILQQHPPDRRVLVHGYEGGFDDPAVWAARIALTSREDGWAGPHDFAALHSAWPSDETVEAVVITLPQDVEEPFALPGAPMFRPRPD
jgi:hypothetical protein